MSSKILGSISVYAVIEGQFFQYSEDTTTMKDHMSINRAYLIFATWIAQRVSPISYFCQIFLLSAYFAVIKCIRSHKRHCDCALPLAFKRRGRAAAGSKKRGTFNTLGLLLLRLLATEPTTAAAAHYTTYYNRHLTKTKRELINGGR